MDAIVAVNDDWGIGADGTQSFVLKADRKFFAEMTKGCAVIVGRRTMQDFPGGKPLKTDRISLLPEATSKSKAQRSSTAPTRLSRKQRNTSASWS